MEEGRKEHFLWRGGEDSWREDTSVYADTYITLQKDSKQTNLSAHINTFYLSVANETVRRSLFVFFLALKHNAKPSFLPATKHAHLVWISKTIFQMITLISNISYIYGHTYIKLCMYVGGYSKLQSARPNQSSSLEKWREKRSVV